MLDQLFGLFLLGMGIKSVSTPPSILGVENSQSSISATLQVPAKPKNESEIIKEIDSLAIIIELLEGQYAEKTDTLIAHFSASKNEYQAVRNGGEGFQNDMTAENDVYTDLSNKLKSMSTLVREYKTIALSKKLSQFKDRSKKAKIEEIQVKILTLVSKRITAISQQIDTLTEIIAINKEQVSKLANGRDTKLFDEETHRAMNMILAVKQSVLRLVLQSPVISLSSEINAKKDVNNTVDTMLKDIQSAESTLKYARNAVSGVIWYRTIVLEESINPMQVID